MKILIAYYSRTGTTKKVAELLAEKLGAELEEIRDTVDRVGAKGSIISGKEGTFKQLTTLKESKFDPAGFDLVIVGTPIWAWNLSSPTRTYIEKYKNEFKKIAFFCTMGSSGDERAAKETAKITNQEICASLSLQTHKVLKDEFEGKISKFITDIEKL